MYASYFGGIDFTKYVISSIIIIRKIVCYTYTYSIMGMIYLEVELKNVVFTTTQKNFVIHFEARKMSQRFVRPRQLASVCLTDMDCYTLLYHKDPKIRQVLMIVVT